MSKGRVVVAMSGGVDSSVAALLLQQQGYEVVGVTMRLWTLERPNVRVGRTCCSIEDVDDARRVCQMLGVRHYFQNFEREFQEHVVDYFVREYDRGRTPHPCLACNDKIKFDFLLRRSMFLDADFIATGHYARVRNDGERYRLLTGIDESKDQSYVLFMLGQSELSRLLLPVGEYPKSEIRSIASDAGLLVADKPDSQEICFIPNNDYREFVADRTRSRPGDFVDSSGNVIGKHEGIQHFTIGQRRGLGLPGNTGEPIYVTRIVAEANQVVLGPRHELDQLRLWASRVNYVSGFAPVGPMQVTAKIRYKSMHAAATLTPGDGAAELKFDSPQRAVTPGQAVAFYDGEEVVGGGIIETTPPADAAPKEGQVHDGLQRHHTARV
ncbi:MAG: tRNA 2-thiouridine(34) synthase MnmA [SAR202 cluster bacterium]|mgnify:FL=1|nr:tRNA 2-thiouridine(34) synthase MnmA [SAR202 cluster bacterium]